MCIDTCIKDTQITGTLHKGQYTFLIIPRSVILLTRNVTEKSCRENQNTHFVFSNIFEHHAIYVMIWHMCIACWITKATDAHSEYIIFICFSTATMVAQICLSVTLYMHCCLI